MPLKLQTAGSGYTSDIIVYMLPSTKYFVDILSSMPVRKQFYFVCLYIRAINAFHIISIEFEFIS